MRKRGLLCQKHEHPIPGNFGSELFLKWYDPNFAKKLRKNQSRHSKNNGDGNKEKNIGSKKSGAKEIISIIVSISLVIFWQFDAITILFKTYNEPQIFGYVVTGLIIVGGSKGFLKLFRDVLDFRSSAERARKEEEK